MTPAAHKPHDEPDQEPEKAPESAPAPAGGDAPAEPAPGEGGHAEGLEKGYLGEQPEGEGDLTVEGVTKEQEDS